jgi:hypothetical protein
MFDELFSGGPKSPKMHFGRGLPKNHPALPRGESDFPSDDDVQDILRENDLPTKTTFESAAKANAARLKQTGKTETRDKYD